MGKTVAVLAIIVAVAYLSNGAPRFSTQNEKLSGNQLLIKLSFISRDDTDDSASDRLQDHGDRMNFDQVASRF